MYTSQNIGMFSRTDFNSVHVTLASPSDVLAWSYGEVLLPDTINYRSYKPELGGLFCARIFGPLKDYECLCGKYKGMKYNVIVCDKCGVEVTSASERRRRMGHITLAVPVVHTWYFRSLPCRIGLLLDISPSDLEKIIYFESYIVLEPSNTQLKKGDIISEAEFKIASRQCEDGSFKAGTGAEVIKSLLSDIDVKYERNRILEAISQTGSELKKTKLKKRLSIVEDFIESKNAPSFMVLDVLPVMPPDLRPLIPLEGGRFATSDLNELYRRVINRNNRLKKLLDLNAPDIVVCNEKRMLQEAVDTLIENKGNRVMGRSVKRPLKSLTDMLKGKQGRFRQNLLGKRVDYSGRAVIVVGPNLKLHQCGLPYHMAIELFKPFLIAALEKSGKVSTFRKAKNLVQKHDPMVIKILPQVVRDHPVLLNRAPTLHRLGIQAFEVVLVEGVAIKLHPLVCAAFNADFDGDQMAVHLPITIEAQIEALLLMHSAKNILNPANGQCIMTPAKDMILGLYYLTLGMDENETDDIPIFYSIQELKLALFHKKIPLHKKIYFRKKLYDIDGNVIMKIITTTPGRVLVMEKLPDHQEIRIEYANKALAKKEISELVEHVHEFTSLNFVAEFLDAIMELGFRYATIAGVSICKDDLVVPDSKKRHIDVTTREIELYDQQYQNGFITSGEKYNKAVDAWLRCNESIGNDVVFALQNDAKARGNGLWMMIASGARGSPAQLKQISGARGLIARADGTIIETPILSNFKEGLSPIEYFLSTYGARKGLVDTALKTADSGYLERRLIDAAQDSVINMYDCGTEEFLSCSAEIDSGELVSTFVAMASGRVLAHDVFSRNDGQLLLSKGKVLNAKDVVLLEENGIESIGVRSSLFCKAPNSGICSVCYGTDLAYKSDKLVDLGTPVGVIAAQSIGEPGTQLTLRTFHIGGAVQQSDVESFVISSHNGILRVKHQNFVTRENGEVIVMSRNCEAVVVDEVNYPKAIYKIPYGSKMLLKDGDAVVIGTPIAEWEPLIIPVITEKKGKIKFVDFVDGVTINELFDDITGRATIVVNECNRRDIKLEPSIVILGEDEQPVKYADETIVRYVLPKDAVLSVVEGQNVEIGDIMARVPKGSSKARDIIGGLPRVVELFEAREPKEHSIISEIDGVVSFGKDYKSKRRLIVTPLNENEKPHEYFVPRYRNVVVNSEEFVKRGALLVEGDVSPSEILSVMGKEALARYMISEIKQVYRLQGVSIHNKHIEVLLRQMMGRMEVISAGSTNLVEGEIINEEDLIKAKKNIKVPLNKAVLPEVKVVLQGISNIAVSNPSFLAAASFQETTNVLIEAAIKGKRDYAQSLKASIICGKLIKAGTGFHYDLMVKNADSIIEDLEKKEAEQINMEKRVMDMSDVAAKKGQ
ncbi:DNA-directed RNA polymerase subunit beta' [Candidatus Fokinia solitaria]|uniref:DNA-directed RNA polymerase subunit beta' n=1 Tax=Candidatus Fokinia solitaria TaxID=1802984 RepID=A0A2U8BSF7_9RICK|nr:DNA-directed RNA polymerase subunit beta' [Candidatus Fokinia solitaria]AWD33279.1 DNA-directed RNA polymerase subunit beta' [Candidatus Fokinia solitaria]